MRHLEDVIQKSIDTYGTTHQTVVCMEECAELIQALSKELRGKSDPEHLAEEIADVEICLDMLMAMYPEAAKNVQAWYEFKIERQALRLEVYDDSNSNN